MTLETIATGATSLLALAAAVAQHFRVSKMPIRIKEEIKAEAIKAAALLIADSLVAAAKIKADARLAAGGNE